MRSRTRANYRHLDESQCALVAARVANLKHSDNQHSGAAHVPILKQVSAAAILNVSERSVRNAAASRPSTG